jgi:hypothetical protein
MPAIETAAIRHQEASRTFGNEIVFDRNEYAHVEYLIKELVTIPPARSATSMT